MLGYLGILSCDPKVRLAQKMFVLSVFLFFLSFFVSCSPPREG